MARVGGEAAAGSDEGARAGASSGCSAESGRSGTIGNCPARVARQLQEPDTPSGEDQTANYYGISHFPCCITNFPQGWPKFAQSAVLADVLSRPPAVVLASLVPLVATVAAARATVVVDSHYPLRTRRA